MTAEGLATGFTIGVAAGFILGWLAAWRSADQENARLHHDVSALKCDRDHWRKVATERREVLEKIRKLTGVGSE